MTQTVEPVEVAAPAVPPVAAPIRAVDVLTSERSAELWTMTARITVDSDDPNLRGHFPGLPVYPGIFVIETLIQAVIAGWGTDSGVRPVLRSVRSVRFLATVLGGDELTLQITAKPRAEGGWDVRAEGSRGDGTKTAKIRADFDLREVGHV